MGGLADSSAAEARAIARFVRVPPDKARILVDAVRGKSVEQALAILKFLPNAAATDVAKVIRSAAANAANNLDLNEDDLYVARTWVDQGPVLKRIHPRARGQAYRILHRTCHITVVVAERPEG